MYARHARRLQDAGAAPRSSLQHGNLRAPGLRTTPPTASAAGAAAGATAAAVAALALASRVQTMMRRRRSPAAQPQVRSAAASRSRAQAPAHRGLFLAALPLWRRVVGAGAPLRWSLSGCGLGIIVLMVAASPTRTLRPCAWQYTRNAQHLPKWWARSRAFLLRGSSRATVQRRFLRPTSTHSPNPTHPPTHPTNQ